MTSRRRVLVTGGSRGIGAAICAALAHDECAVAVHYASGRAEAERVCAGLPGEGHLVVGGDLADAEQVREVVDTAAAALGGLDILVNNAGIFVYHPISTTTYDEWQETWRRTLDVNLVGPANAAWCAVRHMAPGGRIINVGSRGAFRGEPDAPAYGASKAGLTAMGQSLARALGDRGIAVTTVAPGFVQTDMAREALAGDAGAAVRAQSPFDRVATAEEVAAAVAYLASPLAEWASGSVLDLNGASYLRM